MTGDGWDDGYRAGTEATMGATLDPSLTHSAEWLEGWDDAQSDLFGDYGTWPTSDADQSGSDLPTASHDGPTVQPLTLFAAPDPFGTIPMDTP